MRRLAPLLAALGAVVLAGACVAPPRGALPEADPPDPIDLARHSVVRIRNTSACGVATGTGFVVDGGRIVTNRHVIAGARRLDVETWDGRPVAVGAAREGVDTDLGVIELRPRSARALEPLTFDEDGLAPGSRVIAIGYALGGPSVTTRGPYLDAPPGRHFLEPGTVLRYTTSVRPGNSGGPLLDEDGEVVGVVFAYEIATGRGLAVPLRRLEQVLADDTRTRPVTAC